MSNETVVPDTSLEKVSVEEAPTVTEVELEKALALLEGKAIKDNEVPVEPTVKIPALERTAQEAVMSLASNSLKKALDVSSALDEVVALLGAHVDRSLATLQKSIQSAANRDLSIVQALKKMQESIDENSKQVAKMLGQPSASKSKLAVSSGDVLEKSYEAHTPKQLSPRDLRKSVTEGFERAIRAAGANTGEGLRLVASLVKFESTGSISDEDANKVLKS